MENMKVKQYILIENPFDLHSVFQILEKWGKKWEKWERKVVFVVPLHKVVI